MRSVIQHCYDTTAGPVPFPPILPTRHDTNIAAAMLVPSLLVLASSLFSVTVAQTAAPDGAIVPFSQLPACASLCGPLFDVQGACTTGSAQSCFCSDARLKPFLQSTSGVQSVCGAASCKDSASLQQIQTWYEGFCKDASTTVPDGSDTTSPPSSTTSTPATGNKNKPANKTWYDPNILRYSEGSGIY